MMKGMTKNEFYGFVPDVNELFIAKFDGFKKLDSLIRFALLYSWPLSRLILFIWQRKRFLFKSL